MKHIIMIDTTDKQEIGAQAEADATGASIEDSLGAHLSTWLDERAEKFYAATGNAVIEVLRSGDADARQAVLDTIQSTKGALATKEAARVEAAEVEAFAAEMAPREIGQ